MTEDLKRTIEDCIEKIDGIRISSKEVEEVTRVYLDARLPKGLTLFPVMSKTFYGEFTVIPHAEKTTDVIMYVPLEYTGITTAFAYVGGSHRIRAGYRDRVGCLVMLNIRSRLIKEDYERGASVTFRYCLTNRNYGSYEGDLIRLRSRDFVYDDGKQYVEDFVRKHGEEFSAGLTNANLSTEHIRFVKEKLCY